MQKETTLSFDVETVSRKLSRLTVGRPQVRGGLIYSTPEQEIGKVVPRMLENDLDEIPVLSGKEVVGVLSLKVIVRRKNLPPTTKTDAIMLHSPELTPESSAMDLAAAIVASGFRQLLVTEKGRFVGIADRTLLVQLASRIDELAQMEVEQIMTPSVFTLHEGDYVDRAFEAFRSTGVRFMPVIDSDGRMTGALSVTDLARLGMRGRSRETFGEIVGSANPVEITVGSIASREFASVSPGDTMRKLFGIMLNDEVRAVPVLREGAPVGIVTKYDIAQLVNSLKPQERVYVQITGLHDRELRDELFNEVGKSMKRIDRVSRPVAAYIHVHTYNSEFGKIKYSFSAKLQTVDRLFVAKAHEWDPIRGMQETLDKLERLVMKMKSIKMDRRKGHQ